MSDLLQRAKDRDFDGVLAGFRDEPDDVVFEVAEYLREEDIYQVAIELYRHLLARGETSGSHFGVGQCLGKIYEYEEAVSHLRRAFVLDPGREAGATYLAYILERLGQLDEAAGWYERGLRGPDGDDLWSRSHYAWFLEKWGKPDEAEAAYEDVLARNPAYTWALKRYALLLRSRGDEERGRQLLAGAVESFPQNLFARLNLVEYLLIAGRFDEYEGEAGVARGMGGPPWVPVLLDLFDYTRRHLLAGTSDGAAVAAWEAKAAALKDSVHRDFDDLRDSVVSAGGDVEEWDRLVRRLLK